MLTLFTNNLQIKIKEKLRISISHTLATKLDLIKYYLKSYDKQAVNNYSLVTLIFVTESKQFNIELLKKMIFEKKIEMHVCTCK